MKFGRECSGSTARRLQSWKGLSVLRLERIHSFLVENVSRVTFGWKMPDQYTCCVAQIHYISIPIRLVNTSNYASNKFRLQALEPFVWSCSGRIVVHDACRPR